MSATLFAWLAATNAYRDAHADAVATVPAASPGDRWLDVGTGTGLVAREAARRGYDTVGVDRDLAMIAAARRTTPPSSGIEYLLGDAGTLSGATFSVVSAASLLFVVPDPVEVIRNLWNLVAPGGTLVIIETTPSMTRAGVATAAAQRPHWGRRDRLAMRMWATARSGRSVDSRKLASAINSEASSVTVIDGLIEAMSFRKMSLTDRIAHGAVDATGQGGEI